MRTHVRTLVTLYTVLGIPFGNECSHTALLVGCGALLPCAVGVVDKLADGQQVAVLCVHGANHSLDELGSRSSRGSVIGQRSPCGIHIQLLVLAAAVYGRIVHVHDVLALLAVGLHDEFLHLLYGQVNGDNLGDAEERRLQDGVGAVAQTYLLCNLGGVDVIYGDVVLCEETLNLVGQVLGQFLALPDGVEQERAALLQAACHIVHVQVGLNVACHEVRRVHQICGADGLVAEAEVRAGETARLLRVVCEVCLAILVGIVTDNLHGVLVGAYGTVGT